MSKTLMYRLFKIGRIPTRIRDELKREGIVILDEGIPGTSTFLNFRSPLRYAAWKRQWYTSSIILTRQRLVGLLRGNYIINVPLTDERLKQVEFSLEDDGQVFCVKFDANLFRKDWTGTVEYRFRTEEARNLYERLRVELGN
jgi:hypothetical protein